MIIIIPLGGSDERLKNTGYNKPKALINIFGKPIIYYLLECINTNIVEYIYIPYNKEYSKYRFEDLLIKNFPSIKFKFFELPYNTNGATQTLNIALKQLDINDCPILSLDCDNFYNIDIVKLWNGENKIIVFEDNNDKPIYSYIKIDNNRIIDIIEKQKISNYACSGAYGFNSYKQLLLYTQKILDEKIKQLNEYYISNTIKKMIEDNIIFDYSKININNWTCLGTPLQLRQFYNNYLVISCKDNKYKINKMRICFDLDNTLVTYPIIKNDYTTVKPINFNINFLKYLKSFGHTIIIYTARKMNTYNGNVGKLLCDIGKITFDTLDKFNIPFDEIYFGKPYADVYIDDLALNCFDDIEKSLGYYMDKISPRDFNSIVLDSIELYTKKSNDLSGEIYYYNNIPSSIKDLFPLFINYDMNNKWYSIEKINGITVSSLYLSELLTIDILKNIMNSIDRIHKTNIKNNICLNIYSNYCDKLKNRYNNYDYSKFKDSNTTYEVLYNKLKQYEKLNKGKISIIHGDTVMTNIMINNFDKIKFIDMRGKNGDILTIYGDIFYDWAKLYQSLIGYECILQDKNINENYKAYMISYFKEYFLNLYSEYDFMDLQTITKSLLFSLIPLHNNEKCIKYYNLIFMIE